MNDGKFKKQQIPTMSKKNTLVLIKEPRNYANSTEVL